MMTQRPFEELLKAYMDAGAAAVKELIEEWRRRKKIRVGIMAVLQLHGRAGNSNPHLDPGEGRGLRMEPGPVCVRTRTGRRRVA